MLLDVRRDAICDNVCVPMESLIWSDCGVFKRVKLLIESEML